jgi:hypothetical protein
VPQSVAPKAARALLEVQRRMTTNSSHTFTGVRQQNDGEVARCPHPEGPMGEEKDRVAGQEQVTAVGAQHVLHRIEIHDPVQVQEVVAPEVGAEDRQVDDDGKAHRQRGPCMCRGGGMAGAHRWRTLGKRGVGPQGSADWRWTVHPDVQGLSAAPETGNVLNGSGAGHADEPEGEQPDVCTIGDQSASPSSPQSIRDFRVAEERLVCNVPGLCPHRSHPKPSACL